MPLVYVQRYGGVSIATNKATQYIEGTLSFSGPTVIELDATVFDQAGIYTLFDYSAVGASFPGGQAQIDSAPVTVDTTGLFGLTASGLVDDPANKCITVTLS